MRSTLWKNLKVQKILTICTLLYSSFLELIHLIRNRNYIRVEH